MTTHRYHRRAIFGDLARGGIGLVLTAGPLLMLPMVTWLKVTFAVLSLLFAFYLFRTWLRGSSALELDDDGLRATGPFGRAIRWDALDRLELRYFATRRDKEGGWMQMRLGAGSASIAMESTLDGFETVAARAAAAAECNRLALSDVTRENLRALGLHVGAEASGGTVPVSVDRVGMG